MMKKTELFNEGDLYQNRFQIIKKLAQGGHAIAYLTLDSKENDTKVLKVAELKSDIAAKIQEQYKLISSFDHPNIIKAYEFYRQQIKEIQYLFIIMEYASLGDLKQVLGKLKEEDIFKIYHQVKSVIQYIHARGVIHRDLTLGNILLDKMKNVKVIDFGIATQLEQQQTYMETQSKLGTPAYKPIQFFKSSIVSKQNDLWQFGITLIQLVTGIEISKLTNKTMPCLMDNFPEQVFIKYNVNNKFRSIISPLLRKQYPKRKFCDDILWIEPLKLMRITDVQLQKSIKSKLQQLFQLDCSNCLLTDQSGKSIKLLNKLQKLNVSGNNLTDKFTHHIQPVLARLIALKLAFTSITDQSILLLTKQSFLSFIIPTKSIILKQLDISYTLITSAGIMMLPKLNKLTSLAVWSDKYFYPQRYEDMINIGKNQGKHYNNNILISQQCIKQLCKLNLKEICINADESDIDQLISRMSKESTCVEVRGKMSGKSVEVICGMEKLEKVYLYQVKEFKIKEFRSKELISCGLVKCKIDKSGLIKSLSNYKKLTYLNLGTNDIGQLGAIEIAKNMKSLTSLDLRGNNIGIQGAIEIAKKIKSLKYLSLGLNNIGDKGVIEIAKNMKCLTYLDLWGNNISKQGAIEIANIKNLRVLDLGQNNIGMQGVIGIGNLKTLTNLNLYGNKIGDQGATEIAKNMKSLTSLDLGSNNINKQGAMEIAKNMKSLTSLDLQGNNIDNDINQLMKKMMPNTRISIW